MQEIQNLFNQELYLLWPMKNYVCNDRLVYSVIFIYSAEHHDNLHCNIPIPLDGTDGDNGASSKYSKSS